MRAVIRRINRTTVRVSGGVVGEITHPGLMVLAGATRGGGPTQVATVTRKTTDLRLLEGGFSVTGTEAPVLVVSRFILYAGTRKDRHPTQSKAAPSEVAEPLARVVAEDLCGHGLGVAAGRFDVDMEIDMEADSPVTILIEAGWADEVEDAAEGDAEMAGHSRVVMVVMMLQQTVFGCISVSWVLGSPQPIDTVLRGDGPRLAQERPTQFIVAVPISGLVELGFVVFGFAFLRPDVIRVPCQMHLTFGWVSGALLTAYGVVGSALTILTVMSGEPFFRCGWWCLVLWMPHFWMGGIPMLATTVIYLHWSCSNSVEPWRV